jgi:hypothetical protein
MSLEIDKRGNIYIYKGDSGDIVVSGLPTDDNYRVLFTVKNYKNLTVGDVLEVQSNYLPSVTFSITSDFSKMLEIPYSEDIGVYFYGLKTIDSSKRENTLFVDDTTYGDINNIIVFPPKVEV